MADVDLIVIATGRYKKFLGQFLESAYINVMGLRGIYVLSEERPPPMYAKIHWLLWGHLPWPLPTLLRYQAIAGYQQEFPTDGVLVYVDVDMCFVGPVDFRGITNAGHVVNATVYCDIGCRSKLSAETVCKRLWHGKLTSLRELGRICRVWRNRAPRVSVIV